jgi:hypothetical protein
VPHARPARNDSTQAQQTRNLPDNERTDNERKKAVSRQAAGPHQNAVVELRAALLVVKHAPHVELELPLAGLFGVFLGVFVGVREGSWGIGLPLAGLWR